MKITCKVALLAICLIYSLAPSGQAATVVFATNPTGSWDSAGIGHVTVGTPFTVGTSGVTIGALGLFDQDGDGLVNSHIVGIYNMASTLLGSVTIPAGTGADLHDGTRWESLASPISLAANTSYMLAATFEVTGDNGNTAQPSQVTIGSGFALAGGGFTYSLGSGLDFPVISAGIPVYVFGGNMSVIPEPASVLSTAFLVGSGLLIRRRAKAAS